MRRQNTQSRQHPRTTALAQSAVGALLLVLVSTTAAAQSLKQVVSNTKPHVTRHIVVSMPDRKLALPQDGRVVKIYSVAVGAPVSPSPSGEFQIVQRLENPTYYKPGVVIGPGFSNPLGTRWMGLNAKGLGIHGTNQPESIGKNASHGCVRLRNRDAEDLFARVRVGDRVSLVAEHDDQTAQIFGGERAPADARKTQVAQNEKTNAIAEESRGDK